MLTTNLIKKDILKGSEWESGLALGGLACFMTPDLGLPLKSYGPGRPRTPHQCLSRRPCQA